MRRVFAALGCIMLLLSSIIPPLVMAARAEAAGKAEAAQDKAESIAPSQNFLSLNQIDFQIKTVTPIKTSGKSCMAKGNFHAIVTPFTGRVKPGIRYLLDTNLILVVDPAAPLGALTGIEFTVEMATPDESGVFGSGSFLVSGPFSTKLVKSIPAEGVILNIVQTFAETPVAMFAGVDEDGTQISVQSLEELLGCSSP